MPRVNAVLETCLWVEDLDRALAFYTSVCGFEKIEEAPGRLIALSVAGRHVLLLAKVGASREPGETGGGTIPPFDGSGEGHLAFAVSASELEKWEGWLAQKGVPIESRVDWERGGKSLYFRDPDGNVLELATPGVWSIY